MTLDIARRRLYNHHLVGTRFDKPAEVVAWLGAVQSQDYAGAKWAVAQRTHGCTDADLDQAFAEGSLLRTHVLRPTWHFVTPADIRWSLAITAPRVHALNAHMYRQFQLDDALFLRSSEVLVKALEGGRQLTRAELGATLGQAGIAAEGMRLGYLVHFAELEAILCSGARRGKQFTYALLDERAPQAKRLAREEALAELTKRYFTSHGPATLKDFTWWSSLTLADAREGMEMVKSHFVSEVVGGQTLWFAPSTSVAKASTPEVYLLPNYDEYISYADRSAIFDGPYADWFDPRKNEVFVHMIVIDGQIVGAWRRTFKKGAAVIQQKAFRPFTPTEEEAIVAATQCFSQFLGMPVVLA